MAGLELAQKQLLAIWKEVDVDNSGFLDFEEFCFLAQKLQAVMDMSQQEVDDGNDSAAAAQRDARSRAERRATASPMTKGSSKTLPPRGCLHEERPRGYLLCIQHAHASAFAHCARRCKP